VFFLHDLEALLHLGKLGGFLLVERRIGEPGRELGLLLLKRLDFRRQRLQFLLLLAGKFLPGLPAALAAGAGFSGAAANSAVRAASLALSCIQSV